MTPLQQSGCELTDKPVINLPIVCNAMILDTLPAFSNNWSRPRPIIVKRMSVCHGCQYAIFMSTSSSSSSSLLCSVLLLPSYIPHSCSTMVICWGVTGTHMIPLDMTTIFVRACLLPLLFARIWSIPSLVSESSLNAPGSIWSSSTFSVGSKLIRDDEDVNLSLFGVWILRGNRLILTSLVSGAVSSNSYNQEKKSIRVRSWLPFSTQAYPDFSKHFGLVKHIEVSLKIKLFFFEIIHIASCPRVNRWNMYLSTAPLLSHYKWYAIEWHCFMIRKDRNWTLMTLSNEHAPVVAWSLTIGSGGNCFPFFFLGCFTGTALSVALDSSTFLALASYTICLPATETFRPVGGLGMACGGGLAVWGGIRCCWYCAGCISNGTAAEVTSGNICKSLISDPLTPYNGVRCVACPGINMSTKERVNKRADQYNIK